MSDLTIASILVRQDDDGRYCLNDLHKASGGEDRHKPGKWLRLDQVTQLIEELANPLILPDVQNRTSDRINDLAPVSVMQSLTGQQGTFVVKELVYAYAMWISPKFHVRVIRTFDALVSGTVTRPAPVSTWPLLANDPEVLAVSMLKSRIEAASVFACPLHIAQVEAMKAVRDKYDVDYSTLLLSAPAQQNIPKEEVMLEPTELGKLFGLNGHQMNLALAQAGLQTKTPEGWEPTEDGKAICTKHHWTNGNKSGYNLKWNSHLIQSLVSTHH